MCSLPKRQRRGKIPVCSISSSPLSLVLSNTDLLSEILLRLPHQSIVAFKSVSKQWRSVISNPCFQKSMLNKYSRSLSRYLLGKSVCLTNRDLESEYIFLSSIPFKPLSFGKNKSRIKIDQSCNGLLLCSSLVSICTYDRRKYYVFNPYTKQYRLVPGRRSFCCFDSVGLAFDPSKSPYYKVIALRSIRECYYEIDIYSSETSSWKVWGGDPIYIRILETRHCVYWNGCLSWYGVDGFSYYFDVDHERMKQVNPPDIVGDFMCRRVHHFDVCKGRLYMIMDDAVPSTFHFMEMNTDYTGWNIKHVLNFRLALRSVFPQMLQKYIEFKPMFYDEAHTEEEGPPELLIWIKCHTVHQVIWFDMKNMLFKRIRNLERPWDSGAGIFCCGMMHVRLHKLVPSLARV